MDNQEALKETFAIRSGPQPWKKLIYKDWFPLSRIFRADWIWHNRMLVTRNILFKFKATFSHVNKGFLVQSENSTKWKWALGTVHYLKRGWYRREMGWVKEIFWHKGIGWIVFHAVSTSSSSYFISINFNLAYHIQKYKYANLNRWWQKVKNANNFINIFYCFIIDNFLIIQMNIGKHCICS